MKCTVRDLKFGHVYMVSIPSHGWWHAPMLVTGGESYGEIRVYILGSSPYATNLEAGILCDAQRLGMPSLRTCVGGTDVVVWDGHLYTGCTRHSPAQADKLLARVGRALGWEIER